MEKSEKIQKEVERLQEIFEKCDDPVKKVINGLLQETAFLSVELQDMREVLENTGMIKIHPNDFTKQKALPIANEYRRTLNIYSLNIKVLASILKNVDGVEDDAFLSWMKKKEAEND